MRDKSIPISKPAITKQGSKLGLQMPKKIPPSSEFGRNLCAIRTQRDLTQGQLAEKVNSTQRAISHYETVSQTPPGNIVAELAKVLKVTTDELLGLKAPKKGATVTAPPMDPETKRLWKKFQQPNELPEKDRRAVIRLINSLISTKQATKAG